MKIKVGPVRGLSERVYVFKKIFASSSIVVVSTVNHLHAVIGNFTCFDLYYWMDGLLHGSMSFEFTSTAQGLHLLLPCWLLQTANDKNNIHSAESEFLSLRQLCRCRIG